MNSDSQLSANSGHSLSDVLKLPPIGMTEVFSKLHCNHEIFAKCFEISTYLLRYSEFIFINILVSPAGDGFRPRFFLGIGNSFLV